MMDRLLGGMFGGGGGGGGGFGAGAGARAGAGSIPGGFGGAGAGQTLGSGGNDNDDEHDEQEEEEEDEPETQTRRLTFWRDGFSIEDGPLMRYDAPGNREILQAIQSGRAPPSLFGVRYDQPLQVEVAQRTGEDYVPPPKVFKGFEGEGNRLGNVTPDIYGRGSGSGSQQQPATSATSAPQPAGAGFELDQGKPVTSIQIRLADGSK